jgi:predicted RNA binding protein with dsRBD fold (UPF0201 family)
MKKLSIILVVAVVTGMFFHACKKDETAVSPPAPGNEFLTTVQLIITNTAVSTDVQTRSVKQLPGQAINYSNASIVLKKNSTYTVQVKFLDETTTPAGDITVDILARQNYHLVCFAVTGAALTVQRTDHDTNTPSLEVGLQDKFTTVAVGSGSLNVQLRHQPNAKNGDCAPGSTDVDANFPVSITN